MSRCQTCFMYKKSPWRCLCKTHFFTNKKKTFHSFLSVCACVAFCYNKTYYLLNRGLSPLYRLSIENPKLLLTQAGTLCMYHITSHSSLQSPHYLDHIKQQSQTADCFRSDWPQKKLHTNITKIWLAKNNRTINDNEPSYDILY